METHVWPKDGHGVASGSNGFQFQQPPVFWREDLAKEGGVSAVLVRTQR